MRHACRHHPHRSAHPSSHEPGHAFDRFEDRARHHHGDRGRHHGPHRGGRRGARPFDYGELRLVVLAMIAEQPRHGYELMKGIEERMGGTYAPSPGVIYPTLSWLEDMGYTAVEPEGAGRKLYRITPEGEAFVSVNRAAIDDLMARVGPAGEGRYEGIPAPVVRAMENLKLALRLRLRRGDLDAAAETIAAALDAAAGTVEKS
jgi:DNA-binding PadR family transcriptional regulator